MISAGEFRKGVTFEYESGIFTIVEFQHVKPGKGAAFVRTKMKNVVTRLPRLCRFVFLSVSLVFMERSLCSLALSQVYPRRQHMD